MSGRWNAKRSTSGLIARIVARAAEADPPPPDRNVIGAAGRFARDPDEFAVAREAAR